MQQDFPSTSQDFIRALKAPADPPNGHAFSKIRMASQAWSQSTLYFPNKDQVITDWILTRFLKEKDKASSSNPILDVDHWQLLSSLLCCSDIEGSRHVKAWLIPLLNRTPFAPIFIAFLDKVPRLPPEIQTTVFTSFTSCFSFLWPLAKHKINIETLLECFSATLKFFGSDVNHNLEKPRATVCSAVADTYLSALPRASGRKKLSSTFLSNHLELWLPCVPILQPSGPGGLYTAGAETLFSLETLRQFVDDPVSNPVIQALSRIDPAIVLPSLPALLESFHEFTTRNRAGLFFHQQQAIHTITDKVRESTIGFFNACDDLICMSRVPASHIWDTRLRLLSIVEKKNAFSNAQQNLRPIFSEKSRLTVDQLCSQETGVTEVILEVLCCFSRIDFDFVSPYLSSVLPVVAKLPPSSKAADEFLELGLDHHKKARTLPTYFSIILDALGKTPDDIDSTDPYHAYAAVLGGPIFGESHAEKLRKALRGFVTPGQCLGFLVQTKVTLNQVYSALSGEQPTPSAENSERSRKRRKLDLEPSTCSPAKAINFAFVGSVIAIVWTSLPFHLLVDESRLGAMDEIRDANTSFIAPLLSAGLKRKCGELGRGIPRSWPRDILAASALRLQYALSVCTSLNFHPARDTKVESRMLKLLESPNVLPELQIEISRSLLISASLGTFKDVETLIERVTSLMEPANTLHGESWGGKAFQLSRPEKGSRQLSAALFSILSHRWLPTLSGAATAEDLGCFVHLLFEGCSTRDSHTRAIGHLMVVTSLQSPAFWELPELRAAVLTYLSEKTSHLDITNVIQTLESLPPPSNFSLDIHTVQAVYTILRYAPMEYLPKSVRVELTKKAVVFDGYLISMVKPGSLHHDLVCVLSLSREFIGRSLAYGVVFSRLETDAVTKYFLDPRWGTPTDSPAFAGSITERMINAHLNTVFRSYRPDDELGVLVVIKSVQPTAVSSQDNLRQRLLTIVLETVMRSSQISRFSTRVCRDLRSLLSSALRVTKEQIHCLVSTITLEEKGIPLLSANLQLWCTLISLRTWISGTDISVPMLAAAIAKKLLSFRKTEPASSWSKLYSHAILVSLSELSTVSAGEAPRASETFLAIYISFNHVNVTPGMGAFVNDFTPFQSLPVHVFETVLTKILELCSETATSLGDVTAMVRLSQVLLRNAPAGTIKVTQRHTRGSLHLFLNQQGPCCLDTNASLEICRLISVICTERPAALRPDDVMLTWTILFKLLSGSENHDRSTSTDIFREIVGITGALVRHRRDLVLPGLPHLGMVLQRLVVMIRVVRPGLGVKQARTVANSFPFWVNIREPLGIPEFKVLSRLLVSLTTKTTIRLVGSGQENQKMESLVKPFGKHASHVLVAYAQAMNDPLCAVYAATRKELYPGLFALCDLLSDHDREAMMLSALDGGGRAVMKTLWNDYKKQKYAGQG